MAGVKRFTREEIRAHQKAATDLWRINNPEKVRAMRLKAGRRRAGVHPEDVTGESKDGPCEICGEHATPLQFDHCHASGRFRGWLCVPCNKALGGFRDRPELLQAAMAYLAAKCSHR